MLYDWPITIVVIVVVTAIAGRFGYWAIRQMAKTPNRTPDGR
jgi:hypothetical protein